jgi:hypothetical protein
MGNETAERMAEMRIRIRELEAEVKRLRYPFAKCGDCEWYTPTGCRQPVMWSTTACRAFQRRKEIDHA